MVTPFSLHGASPHGGVSGTQDEVEEGPERSRGDVRGVQGESEGPSRRKLTTSNRSPRSSGDPWGVSGAQDEVEEGSERSREGV